MCGIVGVFANKGELPSIEQLSHAIRRMRQRGPDDNGIWSGKQIRLGHARLAVMDVTESGKQPMLSADGRFITVFNGEIYNHLELRKALAPPGAWRGTSDTETLLEAYRTWGVDCLSHFNGMFSFAIWDQIERRLFVARDRMGVKPLYFHFLNGSFTFASRPHALTALLPHVRPGIDPDALRAYFEFGYVPAPMGFYAGVQKLQQAHYLLVDESGLKIRRYWDFRHIAPDTSILLRREEDLLDELAELLGDAVKLRLLSDVPLGAFLSGGIDSALVVAAMKARGLSRPHAFTIAFREKAYNEGPAAGEVAQIIGIEHTVEIMHSQDFLQLLPAFIEQFDEPLADSSAFPTMAVARLARRHVTVALTGDGADELFGGYHYYPLMEGLTRISKLPKALREAIRKSVGLVPGHRAKLFSEALRFDEPVPLFGFLRSLQKDFPSVLSREIQESTSTPQELFAAAAGSFPVELTAAEAAMRLDARFTMADGYLQKVDLATMAFSLEARSPFLDFRMVEWAMRLPQHYKMRDGQNKYLLKRLLCRDLPHRLVYKPKRGFSVPVAAWLRGPLKLWALEILSDQSLASQLSMDRKSLLKLFELHASGKRDVHPLLWAVLMAMSFVACHVNGGNLPQVIRRDAA
jgi:asparagine synthase (glutamine-hydrolysing)